MTVRILLCPLAPASSEDSKRISTVVTAIIETISSHGSIRISEIRDYTQPELELSTDGVMEKAASYLQQHGIADLQQISSALGLDPVIVSLSLHRLIDNEIIGCARMGTPAIRLFYYR